MKEYEKPEAEVVIFETVDVVATSSYYDPYATV
ncbi:unknown [Clostridium sp. CAG:43]|nr:unknown [Clostridium sp. CAG:43]